MSESLKALAFVLGVSGTTILTMGVVNNALNNQAINKPGYSLFSEANGLYGHTEYLRYENGSQEVIIFPSHRYSYEVKFFNDLNGDGFVDRIRSNGNGLKFNKLQEVLIRKHDFDSHKTEFAEADSTLQALSGRKLEPNEDKPLFPIGEKSKLILN